MTESPRPGETEKEFSCMIIHVSPSLSCPRLCCFHALTLSGRIRLFGPAQRRVLKHQSASLGSSLSSQDFFSCSTEVLSTLGSASSRSSFSVAIGDLGVRLSRWSEMSAAVISSWMPMRRKNKAPLYCPDGSAMENRCAASRRQSAEQRNRKILMPEVSYFEVRQRVCLGWNEVNRKSY